MAAIQVDDGDPGDLAGGQVAQWLEGGLAGSVDQQGGDRDPVQVGGDRELRRGGAQGQRHRDRREQLGVGDEVLPNLGGKALRGPRMERQGLERLPAALGHGVGPRHPLRQAFARRRREPGHGVGEHLGDDPFGMLQRIADRQAGPERLAADEPAIYPQPFAQRLETVDIGGDAVGLRLRRAGRPSMTQQLDDHRRAHRRQRRDVRSPLRPARQQAVHEQQVRPASIAVDLDVHIHRRGSLAGSSPGPYRRRR